MTVLILPAEWVGEARIVDGVLDVGGVRIDLGWVGTIGVYVRRASNDLSVIEVHMTRHDGLAQEELDEQNHQAEIYPLGPKEYWRSQMVGKWRFGADQHLMTDEDFEQDYED